jgi:ankyrin repeat protein
MNSSRPSVQLRQDAASQNPQVSTSKYSGHSYSDIKTSDSARVHLGDVHNHNHYAGRHDGKSKEDKRWETFLEALSFERMDFRLAAITPAQGETCRWVFNRPEYLRWRNPALRSSHRGLFWIKGKAGVGKSTIMRCMVEDVIDTMPSHCMISFFFNARGQPLESSVEGMYRSLLLQLLQKIPRLQHVIAIPQLSVESQKWELDILRDILRKAVLELKGERLICIIDALDEGDQADIRRMVGYLEDLTEAAQSRNISLEVCYASRHYPAITAKACESMIIERMTEHAEDIHFYVSNELRVTPDALRDELRRELVKKSQAVFLWVVIVIRRLNEVFDAGATRADLFEVVRMLPVDLRDLLHDIVSKGATDQRLLSAITWMLFAQYTLNIRELYYAIRLSRHQFRRDDMVEWCCHHEVSEEDLEHMQRYVLSACRGLVEVKSLPRRSLFSQHHRSHLYKTSGPYEKYDDSYADHLQVQFIHETVREYLLAEGLVKLRPTLRPDVVSKSHARIADWCVSWIRSALSVYKELPKHSSSTQLGTLAIHNRDSSVESKCDWTRFPLFAYVRCATLEHLNAAHLGNAICLADLQSFPVQQWVDLNGRAQNIDRLPYAEKWYDDSATLLYFLLEGEYRDLAKWFLESLVHSSTTSGHRHARETPIASAERELSKLPNHLRGGRYYNCLGAAAKNGYSDIVQLLLDHGADSTDASAFSQAVKYGHVATMQIFLNHDADPNAPRSYNSWETIAQAIFRLNFCAERGLAGDVQLSLLPGLSISAKKLSELLATHGSRAMPPLELIGILLELRADSDAKHETEDRLGRPLCIIARHTEDTQSFAMARMLLQAGTDVNATDDWNRTALILASSKGNEAIVQLLLSFGADVNHRSEQHVTALGAARTESSSYHDRISETFERIIEMLREAGARDEK